MGDGVKVLRHLSLAGRMLRGIPAGYIVQYCLPQTSILNVIQQLLLFIIKEMFNIVIWDINANCQRRSLQQTVWMTHAIKEQLPIYSCRIAYLEQMVEMERCYTKCYGVWVNACNESTGTDSISTNQGITKPLGLFHSSCCRWENVVRFYFIPKFHNYVESSRQY